MGPCRAIRARACEAHSRARCQTVGLAAVPRRGHTPSFSPRRRLPTAPVRTGTGVRVIIILLGWVMVAHFYACAWYALGWYQNACVGGPHASTWVSDYWQELNLSCTPCTQGGNCTLPSPLPAPGDGTVVPLLEKYILSFYWALSTMSSMGYGAGPVAGQVPEFMLAIVAQITGACLYAAIFGNIAQLIQKIDASGARYQQQLDKINEFVHFHRLPASLAKKLHAYNNFLFNVNRGFNVDQIAAALPLHLQQEVSLHLHEHLVRQVPMFATCGESFIKALVQLLKPQVLLRGDCAFQALEQASTMYFIQNGCVQIVNQAQTIVHITLFSGAYFGELAMLTKQKRTATALAATDCILFYMTAEDFEAVIKDYPMYYYTILDKAMERMERVLQSNHTQQEVEDEVEQLKDEIIKSSEERNMFGGKDSFTHDSFTKDSARSERKTSPPSFSRGSSALWGGGNGGSDSRKSCYIPSAAVGSAPSSPFGRKSRATEKARVSKLRASEAASAPASRPVSVAKVAQGHPGPSVPSRGGSREQGASSTVLASPPKRELKRAMTSGANFTYARRVSSEAAGMGLADSLGNSLFGGLGKLLQPNPTAKPKPARTAASMVRRCSDGSVARLKVSRDVNGVVIAPRACFLPEDYNSGDAAVGLNAQERDEYMRQVRADLCGSSQMAYPELVREQMKARCLSMMGASTDSAGSSSVEPAGSPEVAKTSAVRFMVDDPKPMSLMRHVAHAGIDRRGSALRSLSPTAGGAFGPLEDLSA